MSCAHDPGVVVDSRRIAEVVEELRGAGAENVIVGIVGPGTSELRRAVSGGALIRPLVVAADTSLVDAAEKVFPVPGRGVMAVRREVEGWSFAVCGAGAEDWSYAVDGPEVAPEPVPVPVAARGPDTRVRDGVLGGLGTLGGEVVGAVALSIPGALIGSAFPCVEQSIECWSAFRGLFVGGGIGTAVGGVTGASLSAMIAHRDPKRAFVASTGLVVAGGVIAALGELAAPGDAASVPGLALMVLGLPVAGGIGVALGDPRGSNTSSQVMLLPRLGAEGVGLMLVVGH